jgi:hypothetical protein
VTTGAKAAVIVPGVVGCRVAGDIADVALHGLDHDGAQRPNVRHILGRDPRGEPGREDQS